jgi:hypothetical protein
MQNLLNLVWQQGFIVFSYVLSLQDLVKTLVSFNTLPPSNPLANKSLALEQVIWATTG